MSWDLKDKYAIVGVGQSRLGAVPGCSAVGLLVEAIANAIEDAGIEKGEIDGLITRGPDDVYCHHQRIGRALGLDVAFSTTLDNGGASQCMAVGLACMAIEAGLCKAVVCGYGRDSWSRTRLPEAKLRVALIPEAQQAKEFGPEFGFFGAAAMHALGARRHMHEYGTSREQMGAVALAFREHALRNPAAQMRESLNMDQYLSSRWIVEPFCLFDCSLVTDGAGAVIVTSAERAKQLRQPPVHVLASASANNLRGWFAEDHMIRTAAAQSGQTAYRMAGIGPKDIDYRPDLRLLHLHGARAAGGLRLLQERRRRGVCRVRVVESGWRNFPAILPAASFPRGTLRGCFRSSKRRDNFVTNIRPIGK